MPKRTIIEADGRRFVVLPYTGFQALGVPTEPQVPRIAVPMFETVEESLAEPIAHAERFLEELRARGFDELTYEAKSSNPLLFFRGESREERGILPVMFRGLVADSFAGTERLIKRRTRSQNRSARWTRVKTLVGSGHLLTPFEAKAAARHHGAMSTMLDFTFEPRIAAYFGHPRFSAAEQAQGSHIQPMGIIYALSFAALSRVFQTQGWKIQDGRNPAMTFYSVSTTLEIPYLSANMDSGSVEPATLLIDISPFMPIARITLQTVAVPREPRIKAQQGLFVELPDKWTSSMPLWYMLDFIADKWCYIRRNQQFQDPSNGISETALFPR